MEPTTTIDAAALTAQISGHLPTIVAVGIAVLGVVVAVRAFKWIKGAL